MNFEHTEDRRMIADSLQRYLKDQYTFAERDAATNSATGFNQNHWSNLAEMGIIGALFSENYGGYGGAGFDIAVVFEELGNGLVIEPFISALMVGTALMESTQDHNDLLAELIQGNKIGAFAHLESNSFLDLDKVTASADQTESGWTLNACKGVVVNADAADFFVVSANTKDQGASLFLVDKSALGVSLKSYPLVDGGRAAEVVFDEVKLDAKAFLCGGELAVNTIQKCIDAGLLALCAESLGAMEFAKDETLNYLRTRKQFNVPLGSFQALQHRMVDLLLEIEQARSAVIGAAAAFDSQDSLERTKAIAAAKYTIGKVGTQVSEEAIQLHGGIGMTWELPLSHYAKRLICIDHQLGDKDYHLDKYIRLQG